MYPLNKWFVQYFQKLGEMGLNKTFQYFNIVIIQIRTTILKIMLYSQ